MSTIRNQVILIGNICQEPEIKNLDNEKKFAKFTIATNDTYYNANKEKITDSQFHQVIAWGHHAETIEKYTQKGKEIAVTGKLSHRSYEDSTGLKKYITEIIISEILLLGK